MKEKKIEKSYEKIYNKEKVKITPKQDYYFKKLFGTEGNEDVLKDLLEAILEIKIESLELGKETILTADRHKEKSGILDIRTVLSDGTKINLEMQLGKFNDIGKRAIFYLSKLYVKSVKAGTTYDKFPKTIVIFITDYMYYKDIEKYHTKWMLTEIDNINKKMDNIEIHIIELEKFRKKGKVDEANKLEQWLSYINYDRKEWREMAIKKNEKIAKAEKELEKLTKEQEEYWAELQEKWELDRLSMKDAARQEGEEEGRAKGRAEGKAEAYKETAKKMLERNIEIELIMELTGLSKEEIEKLN